MNAAKLEKRKRSPDRFTPALHSRRIIDVETWEYLDYSISCDSAVAVRAKVCMAGGVQAKQTSMQTCYNLPLKPSAIAGSSRARYVLCSIVNFLLRCGARMMYSHWGMQRGIGAVPPPPNVRGFLFRKKQII